MGKFMFTIFGIYWCSFLTIATCFLEINFKKLPEEDMTADQMIAYQGYPVEIHKVPTIDDYILTMQRIPTGRNKTMKPLWKPEKSPKQAVLLQHGLSTSATNWITNLANQSLGFILADHGYDVWLGNIRGNRYSKEHKTLRANQSKFWEFTWEDMAEYDLPAMIDHILNVTQTEQLVYIGHSQGTLLGFAKFSSDLEFAKKIKLFIALAPVSTVKHITSPVRYLAPFVWPLEQSLEFFGDYSLGEVSWILKYLRPACEYVPETMLLCENVIFFFSGSEVKSHLNMTRLPIYLSHNPDDTSMKNIAHFAQMVNSGRMQKYDYGFFKNLRVYGQSWPPEYYPELMETETVVFHSKTDAFAPPRDVLPLLSKIRNLKARYQLEDYSHLDFLWALNAPKNIYSKILELLKEQ